MVIYTSRKSRCSSAGRALPWGGRGRRFKSCHLDQIKPNGFSPFGFISFMNKILKLVSETRPARMRRGWSGFTKASIYELWGFTVVRRRFKSCHLDQKWSGVRCDGPLHFSLFINTLRAFWNFLQNALFSSLLRSF